MDDIPVVLNLGKNESNPETARAINALKNCMEMLLESQDRVDISLNEYENMKKALKKLHLENEQMSKILCGLGFPIHLIDRIIPGSVHSYSCEATTNVLECKRKMRIEFEYEGV